MTNYWVKHSNGQWRDRFRYLDQTPDPPLPLIGSSHGPFVNITQWANEIADVMVKADGLAVVRTFSTGAIGNWTSDRVGTIMNNYEATVWHSFKSWNEDQILAWMVGKPDDGRVAMLSFHHEPENDPWASDPAAVLQWKQRVGRLAELRAQTGRTDIKVGPTLMRYTSDPRSNRNYWGNWYVGPPIAGKTPAGYPGYARQDFIGWDAYNQGSPNYSTPSAIFRYIWGIADATDVPWAIGEFGSEQESTDPTDTLRAQWIEDYVTTAIADGRCMAVCYWNSVDSGYDCRIFNTTNTYKVMIPYFQASRDYHGIAYPKGS